MKHWLNFNAQTLEGDAVRRLREQRFILAFSRTTSFGDLVNTWNSDLLKAQALETVTGDNPAYGQDDVFSAMTAKQFYG